MLLENMDTDSLTALEEQVLDAARRVYRHLGPEHARETYLEALCDALERCEFDVRQNVWLPEMLHGSPLNVGQVADILIADTVALQVLAAVPTDCDEAHLQALLRRLRYPLGFLVNFSAQDFEGALLRISPEQIISGTD